MQRGRKQAGHRCAIQRHEKRLGIVDDQRHHVAALQAQGPERPRHAKRRRMQIRVGPVNVAMMAGGTAADKQATVPASRRITKRLGKRAQRRHQDPARASSSANEPQRRLTRTVGLRLGLIVMSNPVLELRATREDLQGIETKVGDEIVITPVRSGVG